MSPLTPAATGLSFLDPRPARQAEGRLAGWQIPAKDLYDVAGQPTTLGSKFRTYLADTTDPFLQNLLDQGASIPGKTASSELGMSIDCEPVDLPAVDNPRYPGCTPGGSSGGAAVAVAQGLFRAAHASDAGGSIRVPAAACGVVGFKTSSLGLSCHGFITRDVADQAFLHGLRPRVGATRIGVMARPLWADTTVDSFYLGALERARAALQEAGHTLVPVVPFAGRGDSFEAFTDIFTYRLRGASPTSPLASFLARRGRQVSPARLRSSIDLVSALANQLRDQWGVDKLLTPMFTHTPPRTGAMSALPAADYFDAQTRWSPWASLFNLTRTPAIALADVQLGSLSFDDEVVLGLGLDLEAHL